MKTTIARISIVALALAGFAVNTTASSHVNRAPAKVMVAFGGSSAPVPMCLPGDPTHCGMD